MGFIFAGNVKQAQHEVANLLARLATTTIWAGACRRERYAESANGDRRAEQGVPFQTVSWSEGISSLQQDSLPSMTLSWRFLLILGPERARRLSWAGAPNPSGRACEGGNALDMAITFLQSVFGNAGNLLFEEREHGW
jgi:hypothetical protein